MADVRTRVAAHRRALREEAGLDPRSPQYIRTPERPFTAADRDRVTVLVGGLTPFHDRLLTAVFETCGYRSHHLPQPDAEACEIGRQYCDVGLCNPAYFTIGNLVKYLRGLEAAGLSRGEIADRYVFFTSGTCGPCRFGMYEAQYRLALDNAGFSRVRVLTFQQNDGLKASAGESGLTFSVHFGLSALNAFNYGDVLHDAFHRLKPFECRDGDADEAFDHVVGGLWTRLRDRRPFDILEHGPAWLRRRLSVHGRLKDVLNGLLRIRQHLRGRDSRDALADALERLDRIDLDRLRVKPVVKVTGEFWAAITAGAGNFEMFRYLEDEGAEVRVDPIVGWVMYLLFQGRQDAAINRRAGRPERRFSIAAIRNELRFAQRALLFALGEWLLAREHHRVVDALGGVAGRLTPQSELARLADPYYNARTRGGEGHLEVGKTIYYSSRHHCHMVLSLKPFGCLPSTQSDGVQSAVTAQLRDINFLSIETSGDGQLQAYSRVQMALAEARDAAQREFDAAVARCGRTLDEVRAYAVRHPELRRPSYVVPVHAGIAGTAANFVLHVADLMRRRA